MDIFSQVSVLPKFQCCFGSYPTTALINELRSRNVNIVVNLTSKPNTYYDVKDARLLHYHIQDFNAPRSIRQFIKFLNLLNTQNRNNYIFFHCRGGHGRSGLMAASWLCWKYHLPPSLSLRYVRQAHNRRHGLKEYRMKRGCPDQSCQKQFVKTVFGNYMFPVQPHYTVSKFEMLGCLIINASSSELDEYINYISPSFKKWLLSTYSNVIVSSNLWNFCRGCEILRNKLYAY